MGEAMDPAQRPHPGPALASLSMDRLWEVRHSFPSLSLSFVTKIEVIK